MSPLSSVFRCKDSFLLFALFLFKLLSTGYHNTTYAWTSPRPSSGSGPGAWARQPGARR